jgi:hypothetical protein
MLPNLIKREKYIALHAQKRGFRIRKWIILIVLFFLILKWKGWSALGLTIAIAFVLGTSLHFFLRYKTKGWRQSWGLFKAFKTPFD